MNNTAIIAHRCAKNKSTFNVVGVIILCCDVDNLCCVPRWPTSRAGATLPHWTYIQRCQVKRMQQWTCVWWVFMPVCAMTVKLLIWNELEIDDLSIRKEGVLSLTARTCFYCVVMVVLRVTGSLAALVYQHSITPLALPCKLLLPEIGKWQSYCVSSSGYKVGMVENLPHPSSHTHL